MILSIEDIANIITTRPNRKIVELAQTMQQSLRVHVTGEGVDEYLTKINSFENENQYIARKRYCKSSKAIFEQLGRPIDRIFSARGGAVYHNMDDDNVLRFNAILDNVENGLSLRKWMESYWKPAYLIDPMGIVMIEVGNNDAWPEYKNSSGIYDYQLNGRKLDYIIFTPKNIDNKIYYRVVDAAYDYTIDFTDNKNVIIVEQFVNPFGRVPAIIVSDINKFDSEAYESIYAPIVDEADEYLRDSSVKSVFKLMCGYPRQWEYANKCGVCEGTGNIKAETCTSCRGTGYSVRTDVSETVVIAPPGADTPSITQPMGYITPDIEGWKMMNEEEKTLSNFMHRTLWGTQQVDSLKGDTATSRFIDSQPVLDRLDRISVSAESTTTELVNLLGIFFFKESYRGSTIIYGRRYQIESPDALIKAYQSAKQNNVSISVLNSMLIEYIYSKYNSTDIQLRKELVRVEVEPFKHYTIEQVLSMPIDQDEILKKIYFDEFLSTLSDADYLNYNAVDNIKKKLNKFINNKKNVNYE